jgi:hypothetical protein
MMPADHVHEEASMEKTKKPYRRPRLTTYGDVRDITQTTNGAGLVMDKVTGMNKSA